MHIWFSLELQQNHFDVLHAFGNPRPLIAFILHYSFIGLSNTEYAL